MMNYKKYKKTKLICNVKAELFTLPVFISALLFIFQTAKLFGVTDIEIPHTSILFAQSAAVKAGSAIDAGNRVLGWCYWGFIVFIGLCLLFSAVCCIFKRKIYFSFFLYIPLLILFPDVYFAVAEKDYILAVLHLVFGIMPLFAIKPLNVYRGLKDSVWGENFKSDL